MNEKNIFTYKHGLLSY